MPLYVAAARIGAPVIGLNTRYRADELRHVLIRSDAAVLVGVDEFAGVRFAPIAAAAGAASLSTVVVVGDDPTWDTLGLPVVAWDDLPVAGAVPSHRPSGDDLVIAFTTSGTTGMPKLAVHDQAGVVVHAHDDARVFDVRPGDRMLLDLPLCGTFGFSSLLAAVGGRATTLLDERFEPDDTARAIADEGVTHYNASDDMLLRILDTGRVQRGAHQLREVGFANFTNAALDAATAVDAVGVSVSGAYGMSEVFAILTRWPATMTVAERARSGGVPVGAATELRVIDPESGNERAVGEEGELCIRGPTVLRRYLGDPAATSRPWPPTAGSAPATCAGSPATAVSSSSPASATACGCAASSSPRRRSRPAWSCTRPSSWLRWSASSVPARGRSPWRSSASASRWTRTICGRTAPPASPTSRSPCASWPSTSSPSSTDRTASRSARSTCATGPPRCSAEFGCRPRRVRLAMPTEPNQPASDEADPEKESAPAGVIEELEELAKEKGATSIELDACGLAR